jgi:ferredoxin
VKRSSRKAHIVYFSGTGNTAFIAAELAEMLRNKGIESELLPIELLHTREAAYSDLLLFGFPVYGARMPRFLHSRLQQLPQPDTGRLFLFATYGLYAGNALRAASLRFARLGFVPAGAAEFKLPGSDGLAFLKKDSRAARKALETDFRRLPRIREPLEALAEAAAEAIGEPAAGGGEAAQEFAAGLAAYRRRSGLIDLLLRGALRGMEKSLSRKWWADTRCTRCGLCIALCPTANITLPAAGAPQFGTRCVLCMRCLHQCPSEAIQLGSRTSGRLRWQGPDGTFRSPRLRDPFVIPNTHSSQQ